VLKVITQNHQIVSRSNGLVCGSSINCNHSHKNHAEMQLLRKLKNNKMPEDITITSESQNTQPCYHCIRSLLKYIQNNPNKKFVINYKKNNEFIKIKSTQLHNLLNTSVVSSGMRTHRRLH